MRLAESGMATGPGKEKIQKDREKATTAVSGLNVQGPPGTATYLNRTIWYDVVLEIQNNPLHSCTSATRHRT